MSIPAGQLNQRVQLQRQTTTGRDEYGAAVQGWGTYATVWANVAATTAREALVANAFVESCQCTVRIRYRSDVKAADRLIMNGKALSIGGVADTENTKTVLTLYCTEVRA